MSDACPVSEPPPADPSRQGLAQLWPHPRQRAWVEVNEVALEANARSLRRSLSPGSALMAVVKADGYGHGAVPVARAVAAGGASGFGVAPLQEGVDLRQAGLQQPVLVLGNLTHPEELRACLHWQLMPTLSGMREALLCQNLAAGSGRPLAVHLKLDTGMARLGAPWQEGQRLVEAIAALEAVQLAGLYSHLADADAPGWGLDPLTQQQQQRFDAVLSGLQQAGLSSGSRHLANSAAKQAAKFQAPPKRSATPRGTSRQKK